MQAALSFDACFSQHVSKFQLDLSECTLSQVLFSYQSFKRQRSKRFSVSHIVRSIQEIEERYGHIVMPEDITDIFYSCYISYLYDHELKPSTIENYCSNIRSALKWGCKHRCKVSESFEDFSVKYTLAKRISLTADQVSHIAHFDISTLPTRSQHMRSLERVRDAFVIQTNLFQRFSDMQHLSRSNFKNGIFSCVQQKTGANAKVDIRRYSVTPDLAFRLLEKYDYQFPYIGDISNFNHHLHYLLSHIGDDFDEDITYEEHINGSVVKRSKKLWEFVTSHTARRTAITLATKRAKTETEVRICSGHTVNVSDSFRRYVNDD